MATSREGLLFRKWTSPGEDKRPVEHIVLPWELRKSVLHLAHTIPLAGHMARRRQREGSCGDSTGQLPTGMWLIAAKVVGNARSQLSEGTNGPPSSDWRTIIVGPLPRSRSGMRYVLVVQLRHSVSGGGASTYH